MAEINGRPLLEVRNVTHEFRSRGPLPFVTRVSRALTNVCFELWSGETLAVVGGSGAGKSTLARVLPQMPRPTSGSVWFRGHELTRLTGRRLRACRRGMQMVFQDPIGSLDPKWRVVDIVEEPLMGTRDLT